LLSSITQSVTGAGFAVIFDQDEQITGTGTSENFATETDGLYIGFRAKAFPAEDPGGPDQQVIIIEDSNGDDLCIVDQTDTGDFRVRIGTTQFNSDFFRWEPDFDDTDYAFYVIGIPASGLLTTPADVVRWNNGINETGTFLASGGTWDHNSAKWADIETIQIGDIQGLGTEGGDLRFSHFFMLKGSLSIAEITALHNAGNAPWSGLGGDGAAAYAKLTGPDAILLEFESNLNNVGGRTFNFTTGDTLSYDGDSSSAQHILIAFGGTPIGNTDTVNVILKDDLDVEPAISDLLDINNVATGIACDLTGAWSTDGTNTDYIDPTSTGVEDTTGLAGIHLKDGGGLRGGDLELTSIPSGKNVNVKIFAKEDPAGGVNTPGTGAFVSVGVGAPGTEFNLNDKDVTDTDWTDLGTFQESGGAISVTVREFGGGDPRNSIVYLSAVLLTIT
jgi:hypothetical protein